MSWQFIWCWIWISCFSLASAFGEPPAKKPRLRKDADEKAIVHVPLVYHPKYQFDLFGLEKYHPFSKKKYSDILQHLLSKQVIPENSWYTPEELSPADLARIHPASYIAALDTPRGVFLGFESLRPTRAADRLQLSARKKDLSDRILSAELWGSAGTLLAADLVSSGSSQWAMNLAGGYHHAYADHGSGFCLIADAPIAILRVLEKHPEYQVLIIDLDAHHGDGNASIFADEPRVHIFDVYNKDNFPFPAFSLSGAQHKVEFDYPVAAGTSDAHYLELIAQEIPKAIERVKPQIIYYNAGTDVYEKDPLGGLRISQEGIIARDEIVFQTARHFNVPIFSALSGGYADDVSLVIGASIENLIVKKVVE